MDETGTYIRTSSLLVIMVFIAGLISGGIISYLMTFQQISELRNEISKLEGHVSKLWGSQNLTYQNITIYQNESSLVKIYEKVRDSVVLIRGTTTGGMIQGSGFVYNYSGLMVIITNYHVVHETTSISVTFYDGNGYAAHIKGTDPYADLAVLTVDAPESEFKPLEIVSSSTLQVGDPVIAIGNPFGLVGSMTTGIVSALGRTITEEYTGGFAIANVIQTSTPINPGNSGGPLLNCLGQVVGITTAIVAESQGVGFAIPSNTILREVYSLVTYGKYENHSYLGVKGRDMNYELAQQMHVNITYGWLIVEVISGAPASKANPYPLQENDIIIAMNGTKIKNGDDLASYLEEYTLPEDTVVLTIQRENQRLQTQVVLGKRQPP